MKLIRVITLILLCAVSYIFPLPAFASESLTISPIKGPSTMVIGSTTLYRFTVTNNSGKDLKYHSVSFAAAPPGAVSVAPIKATTFSVRFSNGETFQDSSSFASPYMQNLITDHVLPSGAQAHYQMSVTTTTQAKDGDSSHLELTAAGDTTDGDSIYGNTASITIYFTKTPPQPSPTSLAQSSPTVSASIQPSSSPASSTTPSLSPPQKSSLYQQIIGIFTQIWEFLRKIFSSFAKV